MDHFFASWLLVFQLFICSCAPQNSACLSFFKIPSCSTCTNSCDPTQQISNDLNTLKSYVSNIETKNPASCLYFNSSTTVYSPQCCSIPFTLNGVLFFKCTAGADQKLGCFFRNRAWVSCNDPSFSQSFQTSNINIPTFPNPVPARTISTWIVFQQRVNVNENFDRVWSEYKNGFGNPESNFWLGLEKVYQLCNSGNCQLRIEVYSAVNYEWVSEEYLIFFLDSEYGEYAIHFVGKSGDGDSYFSSNPNSNGAINGMRFTTKDKDHDTRPTENCAVLWGGAWWYNNCCWFNLNGAYSTKGFAAGNGLKRLTTSRMMLKIA